MAASRPHPTTAGTPSKTKVFILYSVFIVFVLPGCGDTPDPAPLPDLDRETFRREIEPALIERCANPSTCHGDATRPYALYAPHANRLNSSDVYRDPPLTEAEHRANFRRTRSFAVRTTDGRELLVKPLAEHIGGIPHDGGAVFTTRRDADYRRISDWIEEGER